MPPLNLKKPKTRIKWGLSSNSSATFFLLFTLWCSPLHLCYYFLLFFTLLLSSPIHNVASPLCYSFLFGLLFSCLCCCFSLLFTLLFSSTLCIVVLLFTLLLFSLPHYCSPICAQVQVFSWLFFFNLLLLLCCYLLKDLVPPPSIPSYKSNWELQESTTCILFPPFFFMSFVLLF